MTVNDRKFGEFLEELASSSATPGGGSAAAMAGAMSAALVSMVCRLTIGKPRFTQVEDELRGVLTEAETLRRRLVELADADIHAFDRVMDAYRLPKGTVMEQAERHQAIQEALRQATQVPLETVEVCASLVKLAAQIIPKINSNTLSDAGTAVLLAEAGLRSAQLNVATNLATLQDPDFVQTRQHTLNTLLLDIELAKEQALSYILEHI